MTQWLSAEVTEKVEWTEHLFSLRFRCAGFPVYQAGQFVKLSLVIGEHRVSRAYSLVSAPKETQLEVLVVRVEDGQLSPYLQQLEIGDSLDISHLAYGHFTLADIPPEHNLWLLATGTGVSPFISMLEQGQLWQRKGKVYLIYGVRYQADLAYYQRIRRWLEQYSCQFCFVPVVSREIPDFGLHGRITTVLQNQRLQKVCGKSLDPDSDSIMLCGNPEMIQQGTEILKQQGHRRFRRRDGGSIHTERYW